METPVMANVVTNMLSKLRVDLGSEFKNRKLYDSLRNLVVMLFAIVFGVGLSKISEVTTTSDGVLLATVYIAILLSWWGYNLGVIGGPAETNILCYAIDVILLVLYWFMIECAFDLGWVLRFFLVMFALYVVWEAVRWGDVFTPILGRQKARRAFWINLLFFGILAVLLCLHYFALHLVPENVYPWIILGIALYYRKKVGKIYCVEAVPADSVYQMVNKTDRRLISKAREAARIAKPHLSNYRVGAAILTADGKVSTGCNIEFDNYSNTLHAEEVAIGSMVSGGSTGPIAIAVYTTGTGVAYPCGMCLQSLFELGGDDLIVIACNDNGSERKTMADLLPHGFRIEHNE